MKFNILLLLFTFIISIIIVNPEDVINIKAEYIYLDPGHGGFDGGAVSNNLIEKEIVLDISFLVKDYLEKYGYNVLMTRYKDTSLADTKKSDIYKRVDLLNSNNTLLYISIHANSYPSSDVHGAQVFYKGETNKLLSDTLQSYLKCVDNNKRSAKEINNKYLLDNVTNTGCIIEVGFLSSSIDSINLKDINYLYKLAKYISIGLIDYLSIKGE